jgi:hypothetical protein
MNSLGTKVGAPALAVVFTIVFGQPESAAIWQSPVHPVPLTSSASAAQEVPDRLVATRTRNNSNDPTAPPFSKTITDRSLVEKLYADISALPPFPTGASNCPNNVGITYRLDFYSGTASLLGADYEPTGCAAVTSSDGTVKGDPTRSFGANLRQALGFSSDRQFFGSR